MNDEDDNRDSDSIWNQASIRSKKSAIPIYLAQSKSQKESHLQKGGEQIRKVLTWMGSML